MNSEVFFSKLMNPLHPLRKSDIGQCLAIWRSQNKPAMFLLSPYRWGRVRTDFQPRSIYL